ncbi:MAG TPA: DUF6328 family protein [Solirubrobacteraceae bacterium]|nr:DUF6328 family protein [Solirubrobacteraceae bacterium]
MLRRPVRRAASRHADGAPDGRAARRRRAQRDAARAHLLTVANRCTLAGLGCVALSMVNALLFVTDMLFDDTTVIVATTGTAALGCVWFWCVAPLLRRNKVRPAD